MLQTIKKTSRGNPVPVKRTFWFNKYKQIMETNRCLFVVQDNNLTAKELRQLKLQLSSSGLSLVHLKNSLFRAASGWSFSVGHAMLLFSNQSEQQNPKMLQQLKQLLGNRIFLLGGQVDGTILSNQEFFELASLPTLSEQRVELTRVLSHPAQSLVDILGQHQSELVTMLSNRKE
jgi:ribosomal protein L10